MIARLQGTYLAPLLLLLAPWYRTASPENARNENRLCHGNTQSGCTIRSRTPVTISTPVHFTGDAGPKGQRPRAPELRCSVSGTHVAAHTADACAQ
jgi:hypothetical protein